MLDIKFIRENKDLVAMAAKKKHIDFDVEKLLASDDKRKDLIGKTDEINKQRNEAAKTRDIEAGTRLKKESEAVEAELKEVMKEWQGLMLQVPNVPDISVPDGE